MIGTNRIPPITKIIKTTHGMTLAGRAGCVSIGLDSKAHVQHIGGRRFPDVPSSFATNPHILGTQLKKSLIYPSNQLLPLTLAS
jgi:hypothetical protein